MNSLTRIARDHLETLVRERDGRANIKLHALLVGPAAAGALAVWIASPAVWSVGSLLTAVAVLAGLLFTSLFFVLDAGLRMAQPPDGFETSDLRHARVALKQTRANVAYATLVALLATVYLGVGSFAEQVATAQQQQPALAPALAPAPLFDPLPTWYVSLAALLALHLVSLLLLVISRVYLVLSTEIDALPVRRTRA